MCGTCSARRSTFARALHVQHAFAHICACNAYAARIGVLVFVFFFFSEKRREIGDFEFFMTSENSTVNVHTFSSLLQNRLHQSFAPFVHLQRSWKILKCSRIVMSFCGHCLCRCWNLLVKGRGKQSLNAQPSGYKVTNRPFKPRTRVIMMHAQM